MNPWRTIFRDARGSLIVLAVAIGIALALAFGSGHLESSLNAELRQGRNQTSSLQATLAGSVLNGKLATFIPYTAPPDTLGFDAAVLVGNTQGPGTLGYFQFQATAPGICDLIMTQVLMRNSLNQPYTIAFCNGRIRVISVTPTQSVSWGEVKARHSRR